VLSFIPENLKTWLHIFFLLAQLQTSHFEFLQLLHSFLIVELLRFLNRERSRLLKRVFVIRDFFLEIVHDVILLKLVLTVVFHDDLIGFD